MEFVAEINDIKFYNDFNSRTVNDADRALGQLVEPVIWIAGGGQSDEIFFDIFDKYFLKLFMLCLLSDGANWIKSFALRNSFNNIYIAKDMEDAVNQSFISATKGTSILYSPACIGAEGFDEFKNTVLNLRSDEIAKGKLLSI